MELSGHSGEIFTAKFDRSGNLIASGSMDRTISMNSSREHSDCQLTGNSAMANLW